MVQKDTYDFEAKRQYRTLLRKFILAHFPKGSQRERLRVACLPGHEGLEVSEIYLPLGVRPQRIWGIEQDPEIAQQIRDLRLGINVYEGHAKDFFEKPEENFDVINLDFQGQFNGYRQEEIKSIIENGRARQRFILGTNFYGARESEHLQNQIRAANTSRILRQILEDPRETLKDNPKRVIQDYLKSAMEQGFTEEGPLEAMRAQTIDTGVAGLIMMPTCQEIVSSMGNNLETWAETSGIQAEEIRRNPRKFLAFIVRGNYVDKLCNRILLEEHLGKTTTPGERDALARYLDWANCKNPYFLRDFVKGKYTGDNGAPMLFDFLMFSVDKRPFVNQKIRIENLEHDLKAIVKTQGSSKEEIFQDVGLFEKLRGKFAQYFRAERQEIQVKPDGEKIREALQAGMPEEEIMRQFNLTSKMQLAGHKAALSRVNGNGTGKKPNGSLYRPTPEEETEILGFLEAGMPDGEIISAYHLTKMQLAARKASRTRKNGGGNGNLELRTQILERDSYRCQYPDCTLTQEDNLRESGHSLHVHHIDYDHGHSVPTNMISLCTPHHAMTNTIQHGPKMRQVLEEKIAERFPEQAGSPLEAVK